MSGVAKLMGAKAFHPGAVATVTLLGFFVVPVLFSDFWIQNFTQTVIFGVVAASAGMLYGRVGLVSLGQVAPYGIGCWICMRLAYATDLPYPLLVLFGGIGAALVGTLIGMPALRVSGLYLALVTLMLAAGVETLLFQFKFPNGGTGFKGVATDLGAITPLRRPEFAGSDAGYFRFVVVFAVLLFALAWFALHRKPGRAWASVMQSEPSALTAGIDITRYKLVAFTLASFMAGCAGGLYAGAVQNSIGVDQFNRQAALFLIAAVMMGGIHSLWGGLLAGIFAKVLLDVLVSYAPGGQFWNDFSLSLFGFGLMMNLLQGTKAMEKKGLLA
jgi:branched-chain amino acid transport system permease protein